MPELRAGHSVSLPLSLWAQIYKFKDENKESLSEAVATLVRHGLIRLHQEEIRYTHLAPTTEEDQQLV